MNSATKLAYSALRTEIVSLTLAPGSVLAEADLAVRLGVSRTPLREALTQLRREGLVAQESGQSARVTLVTVEDAVAVYQARDALEGYLLRLAAERGPTEHFSAFASEFEDLAAAPTIDTVEACSARFDSAVTAAAGSPEIASLLEDFDGRIRRFRHISGRDESRLRVSCAERAAVARAAADGGGDEAARLNTARLRHGLDEIVKVLVGDLLVPIPFEPIRG